MFFEFTNRASFQTLKITEQLVKVPTALNRSEYCIYCLHDVSELVQSEFLLAASRSSHESDGSFDYSSST
ncbi:hypothetical protein CABS01_04965 [Colletotrichum abscissum]|uniref:Uncharacterized protein n=1 Tax=Colletotrichum abscissum TaxID=1671311 RepID=A0A9P9X2G6_9PEZI|nr:uncharacterized protein CABS01_04965 [Colletotrichum abscissum]KAI3532513.1 hypothetical protein CABS02_13843 [Colletotrichum abscissum]KAK1472322.1 hypothetical protein CABS01_04965 [Colletotrichum abscissum]